MEKFEKILNLFIKNPYNNIELSTNFQINFQKKFLTILILTPVLSILFSLIGYFSISEKIYNDYENFSQFYFLYYFYSYLFLLIPTFYFFTLWNYFNIKYKLLKLRKFALYFLFGFTIIILLFPFSLLFIIENIETITIITYYTIGILLFIIYYYHYYKKWLESIFSENYSKYKKIVLKQNFSEDSLSGKFQLELRKIKKPFLTKRSKRILKTAWSEKIINEYTWLILKLNLGKYMLKNIFNILIFFSLFPVYAYPVCNGVILDALLSLDRYVKEDNNVYFCRGSAWIGGGRQVIKLKDVDIDTFEILDFDFAKDKNFIYEGGFKREYDLNVYNIVAVDSFNA